MKELLPLSELGGMDKGASVFLPHTKHGVQHFMVNNICNVVVRHRFSVEITADANQIPLPVITAQISFLDAGAGGGDCSTLSLLLHLHGSSAD